MPATRAGSRWLYQEPDEDQVKEWFNTQPLHEGMAHERYYGGIVIIPSAEKYKVTMQKQGGEGDTYVKEMERASFTPYVKVDTRVSYFWDLVRAMNDQANDDRYVGVIEPVPAHIIEDPNSAYFNAHLPEGFSILPIANNEGGKVSRYILARWSTSIWERQSYARVLNGDKSLPVLRGIGTKQSALSKKYADDNVVMKAETGAIGRALGVAGILVVGTGVATAEDMQEAQSADTRPTEAVEPTLPPPTVNREGEPVQGQVAPPAGVPATVPDGEEPESPQAADERMRDQARALIAELQEAAPDAHAEYIRWYTQERKFPSIDQLSGPALSGAVVKLERTLDEVRGAATQVQA